MSMAGAISFVYLTGSRIYSRLCSHRGADVRALFEKARIGTEGR
jgi:hypothetical protein